MAAMQKWYALVGLVDLRDFFSSFCFAFSCCCCCSLWAGFECAESFWFSSIFPWNATTNMPHFIHFGGAAIAVYAGRLRFVLFIDAMGKQKRQQGFRAKFTEYFWLNCMLKCRRRGRRGKGGICIYGMEIGKTGWTCVEKVCYQIHLECIRTQLESEWRVFGAFCFTNFRFWHMPNLPRFAQISLLFFNRYQSTKNTEPEISFVSSGVAGTYSFSVLRRISKFTPIWLPTSLPPSPPSRPTNTCWSCGQ